MSETAAIAPPTKHIPDSTKDPEGYLKAHGWEKVMVGNEGSKKKWVEWRDPEGRREPCEREIPGVKERDKKTGKMVQVTQHCVPTLDMNYSLADAVYIQGLRDESNG